MQNVGEVAGRPEPVAPDDWRVGLAAELVAGDGTVLGKAVVLSPNIAVTTASVAGRAQTAVQTTSNANVVSGSLGLIFPQFSGPTPYHCSASILGIDGELRFAVIGFSGQPPVAVPAGLLGAGELPADEAECSVVYADDPLKGFFRIPGQVEHRPDGGSFVLYVEKLPSDASQLMGTPVFFESRLVGMVVGGPSRSVGNTFILGVMSVRGMALSKATPAVRALLPWIPDDAGDTGAKAPSEEAANTGLKGRPSTTADAAVGKSPRVAENAKGSPPGQVVVPEPFVEVEQLDGKVGAELFARLSVSSRAALGRAEALRNLGRQDKIHMEHLIAGLFDKLGGPTYRLFQSEKIDRSRLMRVVRETVGNEIPDGYRATEIKALPRLSKHVRQGLDTAAKVVEAGGPIRSRHLLYGALSIEECRMIRALTALGVNKDRIALYDEEAEVDEGAAASPNAAPPATDLKVQM